MFQHFSTGLKTSDCQLIWTGAWRAALLIFNNPCRWECRRLRGSVVMTFSRTLNKANRSFCPSNVVSSKDSSRSPDVELNLFLDACATTFWLLGEFAWNCRSLDSLAESITISTFASGRFFNSCAIRVKVSTCFAGSFSSSRAVMKVKNFSLISGVNLSRTVLMAVVYPSRSSSLSAVVGEVFCCPLARNLASLLKLKEDGNTCLRMNAYWSTELSPGSRNLSFK